MKFLFTLTLLLATTLAAATITPAPPPTSPPTSAPSPSPSSPPTRQAYHTEMAFTQAVIRELNTRTRYRVLTNSTTVPTDADATLRGTILTQTAAPLTYDSTTGETSSYLVTITVKVVLTARDGRVLYQNDALPFRKQYQSTQDLSGFIHEDPPPSNASPAISPRPS